MDLGQPPAVWLSAVAVALGVVAVGLAALSVMGQRRVRNAYRVFSRGGPGRPRDDVLTLLQGHVDEVEALRGDVAALAKQTRQIRELLRSNVSRVATVRYDAFDEMGGRLSFSTALLDERGDGVVFSSINGRTETRTYAKQLVGGDSRHSLSTEEREAVERAQKLEGRTQAAGSGSAPQPGSRPRRRRFLTRA